MGELMCPEGTWQSRVTYAAPLASPRSCWSCSPSWCGLMSMGGTGLPQAEQDGEHQEVAGGGCVRAVSGQGKTTADATRRRGKRWEKRSCLHRCSVGKGRGRNGYGQLCQRGQRGDICFSSHHERSENQPTEADFHLGAVSCSSLAAGSRF